MALSAVSRSSDQIQQALIEKAMADAINIPDPHGESAFLARFAPDHSRKPKIHESRTEPQAVDDQFMQRYGSLITPHDEQKHSIGDHSNNLVKEQQTLGGCKSEDTFVSEPAYVPQQPIEITRQVKADNIDFPEQRTQITRQAKADKPEYVPDQHLQFKAEKYVPQRRIEISKQVKAEKSEEYVPEQPLHITRQFKTENVEEYDPEQRIQITKQFKSEQRVQMNRQIKAENVEEYNPEYVTKKPVKAKVLVQDSKVKSQQKNRFDVLACEEDDSYDNHQEAESNQNEEIEDNSGFKRYREVDPGAEKKWPGWPGDNVFRLVVPVSKVGPIIGRKGELVKRICEETKARIKILDSVPGTPERIVIVTAKEEPDATMSPAMDAVLKVHKRVIDADFDNGFAFVTTRLLVAAAQAGSLIGRQGSTVKSIQDASSATVRILPHEDLPLYALEDDRVVEIYGDARNVRHAMELVISHLRKFLVDRSVLPLFKHNRFKNMKSRAASYELRTDNSKVIVPGPGSTSAVAISPPAPGAAAPPLLPLSAPRSGSVLTQVKQLIQIPLSYADAIIGTCGANISYMRRTSGAGITVQETGSVPGEMTVEIQGTAEQVHQAQELIENFVQYSFSSDTSRHEAPPVYPVSATAGYRVRQTVS